jgi:proline iminopeptidase
MKKLFMILPLVLLLCFTFSCQKAEEVVEETKEVPTSGTINVDGFELSYEMEGTGIPCVIIMEAQAMKRALSQDLRNHIQLIFFEGRAGAPYDESFDISTITFVDFVDDVERVRKHLGFERVCVFGQSIWGLVALEYGRKYPENTSHIIMNGTPPYIGGMDDYLKMTSAYFESHASDERKAAHKENWERGGENIKEAPKGRASIQTYITNGALYWHDPKYDCSWLFEGVTWNEEVSNHLFNNLMPGYNIKSGNQISTPIFLSLGKYDFVVPFSIWDDYKDAFPNLSYNLFEQSGHWAFLEEQEIFDKKLIDWIKNN